MYGCHGQLLVRYFHSTPLVWWTLLTTNFHSCTGKEKSAQSDTTLPSVLLVSARDCGSTQLVSTGPNGLARHLPRKLTVGSSNHQSGRAHEPEESKARQLTLGTGHPLAADRQGAAMSGILQATRIVLLEATLLQTPYAVTSSHGVPFSTYQLHSLKLRGSLQAAARAERLRAWSQCWPSSPRIWSESALFLAFADPIAPSSSLEDSPPLVLVAFRSADVAC